MVDIKKFVDKLVTSGVSKEKATEKVKKAIEKIKEKKDGVTDDEIVVLLEQAIEKSTQFKGERYTGICIGFENKRDENAFIGKYALEQYADPGTRAKSIADGLVREDISTSGEKVPVILDPRKTLDRAGKIPNNNFGKPLRERKMRKCYFIVDNEIAIVKGNIDPIIGTEYIIYGKKNGMYLNVGRSGIQKTDAVDPIQLWEKVYGFASVSDFAIPVEEIVNLAPFDVKLTVGYIRNCGDTKIGGRWTTVNGKDGKTAMFGFSTNEDTAVIMSESYPGNEMMFVVRGRSQKPDAETPVVNIIGAFINPASAENVELLGDISVVITE